MGGARKKARKYDAAYKSMGGICGKCLYATPHLDWHSMMQEAHTSTVKYSECWVVCVCVFAVHAPVSKVD